MIDISKLKELVALMAEHDLAEVDLKNGEESITVKRGGVMAPVVQYAPAPAPAAAAAPAPSAAPAAAAPAPPRAPPSTPRWSAPATSPPTPTAPAS